LAGDGCPPVLRSLADTIALEDWELPLRVVFFAFDDTRGLCHNFVSWIKAFAGVNDDRFDIDVFTLDKEQWPGLQTALSETPLPWNVHVKVFSDFEDVFKDESLRRAHVVHSAGIRKTYALARLKKREALNFKIVVTVHSYKHSTRAAWGVKNLAGLLLSHQISAWHFLSDWSRKDFLSKNIRRVRIEKRSSVFPMGCDLVEFDPESMVVPRNERDVLGFTCDDETKHLMYFAQFRPGKGHSWMIKGVRDVLRHHNVKLWLFGEGTTRPRIGAMASRLGLRDKVICPGVVPRRYVPYLLSKAYIVLVPTLNETFGHNFLEPMFAGIPVVGTPVGIGSWIVQDYITGFRVNWGDGQKMAQRLRLCLEDEELVRRMGKNAKVMAEQFFTWESTARNCFSLYDQLARNQEDGGTPECLV
jgi:glycosyltransferase involved in cell wall biosynthesis